MAEPDDDGIVFGRKAVEQIGQTVREVARRMMNETPQRGRWQQRPGGGGGAYRIWFSIDEVECLVSGDKILTVIVSWFTGGCTAAIPTEDSYGRVRVFDLCGTLNLYTAEQLLNATGSATYMWPRLGDCEPLWIVDDICVIPDCA